MHYKTTINLFKQFVYFASPSLFSLGIMCLY